MSKLPIVEVTQADKDAAEQLWQEHGPFRMGVVSAFAKAFASHRIAAETKAATTITELVSALEGVIAEADRETNAFKRARTALSNTRGDTKNDKG